MTNDFNYDEDGVHVKNGVLVRYDEEEADYPRDITLPEEVTEIGENAFLQDGDQEGTIALKEVVCNCTTLRSGAFYGCESLKNFNGPYIEVLEQAAFSGCFSLWTFPKLSDDIEVIPPYCFNDCCDLTYITLPKSTKVIEEAAFYNTLKLYKVEWSPVLEVIGPDAFVNSGFVGKLTLPESLKTIGGGAFAECNEVTSISLPKGIENIDDRAFEEMENVETIYVPEGIEIPDSFWGLDKDKVKVVIIKEFSKITKDNSIEENGFTIKNSVLVKFNPDEYEDYLDDLYVPEGVTEIGEEAFVVNPDDDYAGVEGLSKVTLPSTCTILRQCAFYSCQDLREVKCLAKLEIVEDSVFSDCNSLEFCVGVPKTQDFIPDHLYDRCSIEHVRFPNHLKTVGYSAFYDNTALEDLRLNQVEVIKAEAFVGCSLRQGLILPEIVKEVESGAFRWTRPPFIRINSLDTKIADNAFEGIETVKKIYVPKGFEVPEGLWGISNPEVVEIIER